MKLIQGRRRLTRMTSNSRREAADRGSDQDAQRQDEGRPEEGTKRLLADGFTNRYVTKSKKYVETAEVRTNEACALAVI